MLNYDFKLVSSLDKVFPKADPISMEVNSTISGLKGEVISFQLAYTLAHGGEYASSRKIKVEFNSDINQQIEVKSVKLVPSLLPAYESCDDNYITTKPGVFPDLLEALPENNLVKVIPAQWRALWIDIELAEDTVAGSHPIELIVKDKEDKIIWTTKMVVDVIDAVLPEQRLIHTEWFHADCLADYYNVDVFSKEHWEIVENYIETASKHGINMILTPIFTPPLDTQVGGERTTIQLIDVFKDDNQYTFDFNKLRKWARICRKHGIKYLEISHLFTQWGAAFTPKIMAEENGEYKRIFGWDVKATSDSYKKFIDTLLQQLLEVLKEEQFDQSNTYFHISDEPSENNLKSYEDAVAMVADHLEGYPIIDALSDFEFYEHGLIKKPIPGNDRIQTFIDNGVEDLWVYYCCAQAVDVSNRFMAMPSARNRILGVQLYLNKIEGFLHWGYNFYNTQYSTEHIDPHLVTDAGEAFASGDPFLVYPGKDGRPKESIRLMVLSQAMYDLRALELLESLTTREKVVELIMEGVSKPITFTSYPKEASYLENLRTRVNNAINQAK